MQGVGFRVEVQVPDYRIQRGDGRANSGEGDMGVANFGIKGQKSLRASGEQV